MILPFLLFLFTVQIQASQYQLTAPSASRYMSMPKQRLQQEERALHQEIIRENELWHQEKKCGVTRNTIGMGAICCITSGEILAGILFNLPPAIVVPCMICSTAAFDRCYQPDQTEKMMRLQEIRNYIKLKQD